jgi:hypothetical protein
MSWPLLLRLMVIRTYLIAVRRPPGDWIGYPLDVVNTLDRLARAAIDQFPEDSVMPSPTHRMY